MVVLRCKLCLSRSTYASKSYSQDGFWRVSILLEVFFNSLEAEGLETSTGCSCICIGCIKSLYNIFRQSGPLLLAFFWLLKYGPLLPGS